MPSHHSLKPGKKSSKTTVKNSKSELHPHRSSSRTNLELFDDLEPGRRSSIRVNDWVNTIPDKKEKDLEQMQYPSPPSTIHGTEMVEAEESNNSMYKGYGFPLPPPPHETDQFKVSYDSIYDDYNFAPRLPGEMSTFAPEEASFEFPPPPPPLPPEMDEAKGSYNSIYDDYDFVPGLEGEGGIFCTK